MVIPYQYPALSSFFPLPFSRTRRSRSRCGRNCTGSERNTGSSGERSWAQTRVLLSLIEVRVGGAWDKCERGMDCR